LCDFDKDVELDQPLIPPPDSFTSLQGQGCIPENKNPGRCRDLATIPVFLLTDKAKPP
jgi:hypothetical protein